jgi:NAD(P)-dependent dehydrogenase (short-subunit alcohol dehydrogenase family)
VSNSSDLDRLFARIKGEKGKLDVVFANAGTAKYAPLGSITEEVYDSIFDINVKGVLFTMQNALPLNAGRCLDHPQCVHRPQQRVGGEWYL